MSKFEIAIDDDTLKLIKNNVKNRRNLTHGRTSKLKDYIEKYTDIECLVAITSTMKAIIFDYEYKLEEYKNDSKNKKAIISIPDVGPEAEILLNIRINQMSGFSFEVSPETIDDFPINELKIRYISDARVDSSVEAV